MDWNFKDISVSDIKLESRPRAKYDKLYEKILSLNIGKGLELELETQKEADNIRKSVSGMLKRNGISDKYIACNRLNKFYCGRIK